MFFSEGEFMNTDFKKNFRERKIFYEGNEGLMK